METVSSSVRRVPKTLQVLFYDYVPDVAERRGPFRQEHLGLIRSFHADGRLTEAGAYGDPVKGGLLMFTTSEAAEAFVAADPYASNGLVVDWRVEPWTVVTE
jgi:uncharacterized protein